MKAIPVIDMPNGCDNCPCEYDLHFNSKEFFKRLAKEMDMDLANAIAEEVNKKVGVKWGLFLDGETVYNMMKFYAENKNGK